MSDKELLELAAKAAGIEDATPAIGCGMVINGWRYWNPLADDGDALRLAVDLKMGVDPHGAGDCAVVFPGGDRPQVRENHNGNPYVATRRAIVRAAAEIGRSMK